MNPTNRVNGIVTGNNQDKYGGKGSNPLIAGLTTLFTRKVSLMLGKMPTPQTVLDVGAGEGTMATFVTRQTGALVTGFDLPDPVLMQSWADNALLGDLITGDAHELPFEDNSFELVMGLEVLEHVADPLLVLSEIARVSSGSILLSVPNEPYFRMGNLFTGRHVKSLGNTPGHWNHWSAIGFCKFASQMVAINDVATPFPWVLVSASPDL